MISQEARSWEFCRNGEFIWKCLDREDSLGPDYGVS